MKLGRQASKGLFAKEALERDVLNRIRWDESLNPGDYSFTYADRFDYKENEVGVSDIIVEGDFFRHGESLIPLHRIRRIFCRGNVVWDKRRNTG